MDVRLEDGTIVKNVPEGITKADLMRRLQASRTPSLTTQLSQPPVSSEGAMGVVGGAVRGVRDIAQGAMQMGVGGLNKLGLVSDETVQSLDNYVNQSEQAYQDRFANNVAAPVGRVGGQTVATAPISFIGAPASIAGRIGMNATQGAAVGALQPVFEGGPGRLENTAVGAVGGAVVPEVLRGALAAVGKASSWAAPRMPGAIRQSDIAYGDLGPGAREALAKAGIDWDSLPDQVKQNVRAWVVQNADRSALTPVEAARLGILQGAGAQNPTRAMLTQDFNDFTAEDLLAHQKGGEAVRRAYAGVQQGVAQRLDDMVSAQQGTVGVEPMGKNVVETLTAGRDQARSAVNQAYEAVRSDPQIGNKISFAPVRKVFIDEHPSIIASPKKQSLAAGAEAWLKREGALGPGAKPVTVETAEAFKQWLNQQWDPTDGGVKKLIVALKDAVDDSVMRAGSSDIFQQARQASAITKQTYDSKELVSNLLKTQNPADRKIAVEDVWQELVFRSDNAQLADLKKTLTKGSEVTKGPKEAELLARGDKAWKDVQATTMEWLKDQATTAQKGDKDTAILGHVALKRAVDRIGDEKLQIIFGPDGVRQIKNVVEALRLAKPIAGTTNPSGSGNRIIDFFRNYMPKALGGAVGSSVAGPLGAAAGAATADTVMSGARGVRAAMQAADVTNPVKSLTRARTPGSRLSELAPRGGVVTPQIFTLRDLMQQGRPEYQP